MRDRKEIIIYHELQFKERVVDEGGPGAHVD